MDSLKPTIVIAGASGFIGRALIAVLHERYNIRGLTRDVDRASEQLDPRLNVSWRRCDLFSVLELEQALEGATCAIYLVHSMMPSARLTQGNFSDLDLILADNFARASERVGVEQIIYLGGIIPTGVELSEHLISRREVEHALGARKPALTALRAGLVVGERGSSFRILQRLVERLPVMICPKWTRNRTHPIALNDICDIIARSIGDQDTYGVISDVGGPDIMTYLEMIERTAARLGRKPTLIPAPMISPSLSRLWVSAITGVSSELVSPLVDSLKVSMVAENRILQDRWNLPGTSFDDALDDALRAGRETREFQRVLSADANQGTTQRPAASGATSLQKRGTALITTRSDKNVCSVQRLHRPSGWSASDVASAYAGWLPRALVPFMIADVSENGVMRFHARFIRPPLLQLTHAEERSTPGRQLFYITGGLLADTSRSLRGRLEFRTIDDPRCVLAAIHEFTPRLPWWLYNITQALVHLLVMRLFNRWLKRTNPQLTAAAYSSHRLEHEPHSRDPKPH